MQMPHIRTQKVTRKNSVRLATRQKFSEILNHCVNYRDFGGLELQIQREHLQYRSSFQVCSSPTSLVSRTLLQNQSVLIQAESCFTAN
jgi:hypothetical protein